MRISEARRNGFTREVNDPRFIAPEFFGVRICSNENDAIAMNRDCFGVRLLFVTGVNVAVNENYLGRFRVGSNSAHQEQDSSDSAHHGALFRHSERKCQSGSDRKFFLPSSGVFIESAHTDVGETFASAARATLTICSSETAATFRQFYDGEKLAVADQFETGPLTLWRTFSRAGQIGSRSSWRSAAW